jgi:hypothetical protein
MIEKIISGFYKAKLYKKRLCDVRIVVWNDNEPATIEYCTFDEYEQIKPYLQQ